MKGRWAIGLVLMTALLGGLMWRAWDQGRPRRQSIQTLERFCLALSSNDPIPLLTSVVLPQALANRTAAEQKEFLTKALWDEVSPDGIAELRRNGSFGPLKEVFPAEADQWAEQAGVRVEDCVGFQLERNGIRAEVVLARVGEILRVVRCNNVKQLDGRG